MYQCIKYNNGKSHFLDQFTTQAEAESYACTMHDPAWPAWQGIMVFDADGDIFNGDGHDAIFDSRTADRSTYPTWTNPDLP